MMMKYLMFVLCWVMLACTAKNKDSKFSMASVDAPDTTSAVKQHMPHSQSEYDTMKASIQKIELGQEFRLQQDDTAFCQQNGLSIKVLKVRDNRCPPNVQCIRAGEIEVDVRIAYESEQITQTLTNPTRERKNSIQFIEIDDVKVDFLGAAPTSKSKIELSKLQRDTKVETLPLYFIVTEK